MTSEAVFGTDDYAREPGGDLREPREAGRLLTGWWNRAASARWPEIIERHTDDLLDDLAAGPADADLVTGFTRPLPLRILADVLGIPSAEVPALQELLQVITGSGDPECP